jgi:hypothetical protein
MKHIYKKLLFIVFLIVAMIIGFVAGTMYSTSNLELPHVLGKEGEEGEEGEEKKDGCMCECEFSSNQNEQSCNDHGGCKWTGSECITDE